MGTAMVRKSQRKATENLSAPLGYWIGGYYQRNGRWYYEKLHCSVCGHEHDGVTPYCEQCGTKMDITPLSGKSVP